MIVIFRPSVRIRGPRTTQHPSSSGNLWMLALPQTVTIFRPSFLPIRTFLLRTPGDPLNEPNPIVDEERTNRIKEMEIRDMGTCLPTATHSRHQHVLEFCRHSRIYIYLPISLHTIITKGGTRLGKKKSCVSCAMLSHCSALSVACWDTCYRAISPTYSHLNTDSTLS